MTMNGVAISIAIVALIPLAASAQTAAQDSLRATIKAEITADPHTSTMTEAQINAMVDALAVQAQKQGVTANQLTNRPWTYSAPAATPSISQSTCTAGFLCAFENAYGLLGGPLMIPIALFVICALFILIYGLMREMGHPHTQ